MTKNNKIILPIVMLPVLLIAGYAVPAVLITDGVERYEGEQQAFAKDALGLTETHLSTPSVYRLWTTKLRVTSVAQSDSDDGKSYSCSPYVATVQAYSYFGLRGSRYRVADCGGVRSL